MSLRFIILRVQNDGGITFVSMEDFYALVITKFVESLSFFAGEIAYGFFARRIASHILMRAISFSWSGAFEDCRADSMGAAKSMLFNFGTMAYFGPFARTDSSSADN